MQSASAMLPGLWGLNVGQVIDNPMAVWINKSSENRGVGLG